MLHICLEPEPLQRTRGCVAVALSARRGRTRLTRLRQEGSAKAFLPSVQDSIPEIVFLNTAGGLTGGDRIGLALTLDERARAVATTQTAERGYASAGGSASVDVRIVLGRDAVLDWLPQETILYDGAALARRTEIELGTGARFIHVETVVLGRAAMGERVRRLAFRDLRLVRREGRPIHVDPFALDDAALARAGGHALLGGGRAVATLVLVAAGAEDAAGPLQGLPQDEVEAAVSGWDGRCVMRVLGQDALPVRRHVVAALHVLRGGRPLPRVWQT